MIVGIAKKHDANRYRSCNVLILPGPVDERVTFEDCILMDFTEEQLERYQHSFNKKAEPSLYRTTRLLCLLATQLSSLRPVAFRPCLATGLALSSILMRSVYIHAQQIKYTVTTIFNQIKNPYFLPTS